MRHAVTKSTHKLILQATAILFLCSLLITSTSALSTPRDGFSAQSEVRVLDDVVYQTAYVSTDGGSWQEITLSGTTSGNWILGQATSNTDLENIRYVAAFSCSWTGEWNCSDSWQVLDRGEQGIQPPSEYAPKDSLQGDFQALQALYESTQGQGIQELASTQELPEPQEATYPYIYIIDGDIWTLSKERIRDIGEWVNHGVIWKDTTGWDDMTPETMGEAVGVEVDETGRVVMLDMQKVTTEPYDGGRVTSGNGLVGVLPEEIGNLQQIRIFNVKQNFFHGEIPDVFENWSALERWSLGGMTWEMNIDRRINWHESDHRRVNDNDDPYSHRTSGKKIMVTNNFRSQLPESLNGLENLTLIEAAHQHLLGPLPAWDHLPSIKAIYIPNIYGPESLRLGEIPDSWGNFDTMQVFSIGNYHTYPRFTGQLPSGMQNWDSIANFQLGRNEFTGELPLGEQDDLVYFTISRSGFSGEFPWDSIFNGKNARLSKFGLAYNDFSGELPQTVPPALLPIPQREEKYRLDDFGVQGNNFSGPLPDWVPEFSNLQIINVAGNSFTGPFPEALLDRGNLKTVYLHNNDFSGPLPDREWSTDRIRWFYISGNDFEGEIPDSWQSLFQNDDGSWIDSTFQRYLFHGNDFTGRIPDWGKNVNWGRYEMYTFDNNRYVFTDMIDAYESVNPVLGDSFRIAEQKPFGPLPYGERRVFEHSPGSSLSYSELSSYVSHPDNVYQWEKDGSDVAGQTSVVLSIGSVSAPDQGLYRLRVTNPNIPEVTLYSEEVELVIS